jgi:hypothetical protein
MADGRSKIRRRATAIKKGYLALGYLDTAPLARQWLEKAALLEATSDMTLNLLGVDAKANRKAVVALQAQAHRLLDRLEANGFRRRKDPLALAAQFAEVHRETTNGG